MQRPEIRIQWTNRETNMKQRVEVKLKKGHYSEFNLIMGVTEQLSFSSHLPLCPEPTHTKIPLFCCLFIVY